MNANKISHLFARRRNLLYIVEFIFGFFLAGWALITYGRNGRLPDIVVFAVVFFIVSTSIELWQLRLDLRRLIEILKNRSYLDEHKDNI